MGNYEGNWSLVVGLGGGAGGADRATGGERGQVCESECAQ